jgi:hypothetical protein
MKRSAYDILNKPDNTTFVWVEAARDLDSAKVRVKELESTVGGEYVVFDQDALQIVSFKESSETKKLGKRDSCLQVIEQLAPICVGP